MIGRPYLTITQNSLMTSLAYRGHFFFTLAGTVIYLLMSFFLWKAVYANGGNIGGLSFGQAYFYVGISVSLAGLLRTAADWYVFNIVSSGDIIRFLTKPMDFARQLLADSVGTGLMNCVIIALPAFAVVGLLSGIPFPPPERILFFILAVVMAFLLNFYFDFLTGLTVFLTQAIGGITSAKESIVMVLSGALVPLAFFPAGTRTVLEWLPFQALYNTPVRLLADTSLDIEGALFLLARQALWLCAFYALSRLLFGAAVKKLMINGG